MFGENRVQEGLPKIAAVGGEARWHLIGGLQRNKARDATAYFDMIESVDSLRLAQAIDRRSPEPGFPVLLQVSISGAPTQGGVDPEQLDRLCGQIDSDTRLLIRGLMTIAPLTENEKVLRQSFAAMRKLRDRLATSYPDQQISELSMGMTSDFSHAIKEGATIVRIGRAIFGDR